jgi:glutamine synthetase
VGIDDVMGRIKSEGVQFIQLCFSDMLGNLYMPETVVDQKDLGRTHEELSQGVPFDGSSIPGFAKIHESDKLLVPDLSSFTVLPDGSSKYKVARVFCRVAYPDGRPYESDPEYILDRQLARLETKGLTANIGTEVEFFVSKSPGSLEHIDGIGYFRPTGDLLREMTLELARHGLATELHHHEVADSQFEIKVRYKDARTKARETLLYKHVLREVAARHGLTVTYMPKPMLDQNGSGMHTHQSLSTDGRNLFAGKDAFGLSDLAKAYTEGLLSHAREIAALTNPTVNSYKRTRPGYEAPAYVCWADCNRSASVRIPAGGGRIEYRVPDPLGSPHLKIAAMLAAGMDGVERGLKLREPVREDVFEEEVREKHQVPSLPGSLEEALEEAEGSPLVRGVLGKAADKYFALRRKEAEAYAEAGPDPEDVTDWEFERYFKA